MLALILVITLALPLTVYANSKVLNIDRAISPSVSQSYNQTFANEQHLQPQKSDFQVINYALMSSEEGERWAVVTLENLAYGTRELNHKHLMALIANGERIMPIPFEQRIKGHETRSFTINFGQSKFPILEVYSLIKD